MLVPHVKLPAPTLFFSMVWISSQLPVKDFDGLAGGFWGDGVAFRCVLVFPCREAGFELLALAGPPGLFWLGGLGGGLGWWRGALGFWFCGGCLLCCLLNGVESHFECIPRRHVHRF